MHVKLLELNGGSLVDARIDDEVWTGRGTDSAARVPVNDLASAERSWLAKVATRAISALAGVDDVARLGPRVRLVGDGAKNVVFVGNAVDGHDEWQLVFDGATLDSAARAEADSALLAFVDAVQGVLLFGDDARGLTKRARGDSPV